MKKSLLLFLFLSLFTGVALQAQTPVCMRDSSILQDTTTNILLPRTYSPTYMFYDLLDACIDQPYNQSITIKVPEAFSGFPINSVSIATTGAVSNLPVGLTYTCDPPNCVFLPNTLGCIVIHGTPTAANAPDTSDLGITALVSTSLINLPIEFPGQVAPGSHYYLILRSVADCINSTNELNGKIADVRNQPNPFSGQTTIIIEALQNADYQFEVFNMLGQRQYSQNISVFEGPNQIEFDAAKLSPGTYFYTIGNKEGKVIRKLQVASSK